MGRKFHRGFVGIPTDLFSDPSICGVGYGSSKVEKYECWFIFSLLRVFVS
ncbi:hypothetical protein LEP1GSC036_0450 [Leptospira weilii str. 2006001853]|uniref:Uncharacterized protein n=2 Tax=Leptospira weilii TaxID=28184 RepID=A0A828Z5M0_9LEPT|nr:hypothetical protein LEP1GSC036_0450 [Leptospira weilii str. 2006001853]EMM73592.1 hypothetical protein LEP1GSC038_2570 [Leptospira weilii str. 2006001855]EMN44851.1 hypothetical protein LEP1GSC086_0696 [Leptospira weilii str. LNT 1234]